MTFFFYSGFDIGNHFCEFMFDYKSSTEWPFFNVDFSLYPNKEQQVKQIDLFMKSNAMLFLYIKVNFLSSYADVIISSPEQSNSNKNGTLEKTSSSKTDINREELINQLMREANYFALASHFFWTLWAINMATSTTIKFGYMVRKP